MKRKNIILAILPIILAIFALQSCTKEDSTTFTIHNAFTQPATTSPVVRPDGTVLFTGTTVNLTWTSENKGNNAVSWNVYFGTEASPALFQSGVTAQTIAVPVEDGITYNWKVEIVDANKVKTTSEVYTFTAVNGTNPDINIDLTVSTDVKTAIGLDKTADQVVDLRFLVLKKSDMSIVATIDDGAANESYSDFGTLPDGDYVLGVDIYSTINAGNFNKVLTLSLSLQFDQLGMINQKLDFPNVMDNAHVCSLYRTYLATVKKVGSQYTITSTVSHVPEQFTWKGTDTFDDDTKESYPSQVTTTINCAGDKTMTGLGFGWMAGYWGEKITSGGTLVYTVSGTTITIPLQKYCKTTYNGAAQPEYSIQGTGTINTSGAFPVWTIHYDFIQGGTSLAAYMKYPYFEAIVTTNPAGL